MSSTVIRSALHAVCAIESMSNSTESRVFNEYKEQWMKRDEVRNMWHTIRVEAASDSLGGRSNNINEGKSNLSLFGFQCLLIFLQLPEVLVLLVRS
jgi:hypothetical protein